MSEYKVTSEQPILARFTPEAHQLLQDTAKSAKALLEMLDEREALRARIAELEQRTCWCDKRTVLDEPIRVLDLSPRALNCLEYAGCHRVGQLVQKTESDLRVLKNFGRRSMREVKDALISRGLHLGMAVSK